MKRAFKTIAVLEVYSGLVLEDGGFGGIHDVMLLARHHDAGLYCHGRDGEKGSPAAAPRVGEARAAAAPTSPPGKRTGRSSETRL
jgi:hypothetical protein